MIAVSGVGEKDIHCECSQTPIVNNTAKNVRVAEVLEVRGRRLQKMVAVLRLLNDDIM